MADSTFSRAFGPTPPSGRRAVRIDLLFDGASVILLAVLVLVVLTTFGDYGITWDEDNHLRYGDRLLDFYTSGFAYTHGLDSPYGGAFDFLGAVARKALPLEPYHALHLLGGLLGLVGLLGVWRLGRLLFGSAGGFAALVLCALTPVYYGHMFNNPKDLPFAVGYIWSLYFLCKTTNSLPRARWRTWIGLGVAMGAAMSVRIGGLLTVCYLLMVLAIYSAHTGLGARSWEVAFRFVRSIGARALAATAIAWAVMIAFWPWAWYAPLRRPLLALQGMSHYIGHRRSLPFGGETIRSTDPPWDYLPRYFGLKLPELVLILALVGLALGIAHLALHWRSGHRLRANLAIALIGIAILFPPAYAILKGSSLYDGMRHFLFVVPPICVVAGGTLVIAVRAAARRWKPVAVAMALIAALFCVEQVRVMRELHPHEYVFFNRFAGGLAGANERYETEYYAGAYREALRALRSYLWRTEPERYLDTTYRLGGCFSRLMAAKYVPGNFRKTRRRRQFWLGYTRQRCHLRYAEYPVLLTVRRLGTPLVYIRDLRATPNAPETSGHSSGASETRTAK